MINVSIIGLQQNYKIVVINNSNIGGIINLVEFLLIYLNTRWARSRWSTMSFLWRACLGRKARILYDTAISFSSTLWFFFTTMRVTSTSYKQWSRLNVATNDNSITIASIFTCQFSSHSDSRFPFSSRNYRWWLQSSNCTICARRWHFMFEIREGFDNQIAKFQ